MKSKVKSQKSNVNCQLFNVAQKGFVVSIVTFFVLVIMLSIGISMSSLMFYRQRIATNSVKSTQSYYAAEAGEEDALLRLKNNPQMNSLSYSLNVNGSTASVSIPALIGGSRTVSSSADLNGITKKNQAVFAIDAEGVSFHYGAQIGAGGLSMSNGSQVTGSVFSSGNITGSGTITDDVIVANNGNKIDGPDVQGNVLAYTCRNSTVDGNLTYVTGGTNTCTVHGSTSAQSGAIADQALPITQSQIDDWEAEALAGGTSSSVTVNNGSTLSLGPKKINGDLTLDNNAILKVTGTLYVTGQISLSNGAVIKLDSSYGSVGGAVLSDGKISMGNGSGSQGTGQTGSYLLLLSTNSASDAITLSNGVVGSVFYTSAGGITVNNNAQAKEITGYSLSLQNNATIQYDSGLANAFFSSGAGAGWKVSGWQEK